MPPSEAPFPERIVLGDTTLTGMHFTAKNCISKECGLNKVTMQGRRDMQRPGSSTPCSTQVSLGEVAQGHVQ